MVLVKARHAVSPWEEGHFIGGHLALDLTNTVFNRAEPVADNELLKTSADVSAWCQSVGLVSSSQAAKLATGGGERFVNAVRRSAKTRGPCLAPRLEAPPYQRSPSVPFFDPPRSACSSTAHFLKMAL